METLARAALIGAATGARTFTGLAVLALTAPKGAPRQPDRLLRSPRARGGVAVAALQELALDKLPQAPSRLAALGLGSRVVAAAGCGVVASRRRWPVDPLRAVPPSDVEVFRRPTEDAVAAAVGVLSAVGAAYAGTQWRALSSRIMPDAIGALVEDAAAIGLAFLGCSAQ